MAENLDIGIIRFGGLLGIGFRLYGRVDQINNSIYVGTKFFHYCFIPLIPLESWIIVTNTQTEGLFSTSWQGKRIALSLKSIFFAWLRVPLLLFGFAAPGSVWLSYTMTPPRPMETAIAVSLVIAGLVSLLLFVATYWLSRARQARAAEIKIIAGLR